MAAQLLAVAALVRRGRRPAPARGARRSARRGARRSDSCSSAACALPSATDLAGVWPLLVVLGVGMLALAVRIALGNPLGRLRRPLALVRPARGRRDGRGASLAGLAVYLALVPLVVAPAALAALARDARRGSGAAAAFVASFLSVNVVLVLVVGAFSSTEFGVGFLHDRYLFYVVPLWLVLTAWWAAPQVPLRPGLARRRRGADDRPARDAPAVPPERRRRPPLRRDRQRAAVGAREPPRVRVRADALVARRRGARRRGRSRSPSRGCRAGSSSSPSPSCSRSTARSPGTRGSTSRGTRRSRR